MERILTGVQTSGGKGTRSRPLSLYSPTSMIPKGMIRIMGIPISEIQLEQFRQAKIENVHVITQYLENREHISNRFREGIPGFRVHYSDPANDEVNNGSADAYLTHMEQNGLQGDSVWLANDNLYEMNIKSAMEAHRDLGAVVSVLSVHMRPEATIKNYGLLDVDELSHRVQAIIEKPKSEEEIIAALRVQDPQDLSHMRVNVNSGGYIVNNDALSRIAQEDWVVHGRKRENGEFDMAGSLLKGLIEKGHPVYVIPLDNWGDFGSLGLFIDTFPQALGGAFPSIQRILKTRNYTSLPDNVWIHNEALTGNYDGKTLEKRIADGDVKVGPNVFVGRKSVIENDADISFSDLEKYSRIGRGAKIHHAYLSPYCNIGPFAYIGECALGFHVRVHSSEDSPTNVNGRSVIGPSIAIPEGTRIANTIVSPGFQFDPSQKTYKNAILEPSMEQIIGVVNGYRMKPFT